MLVAIGLSKHPRRDGIAIGDISQTSWYIKRFESSSRLACTMYDNYVGRLLATVLGPRRLRGVQSLLTISAK